MQTALRSVLVVLTFVVTQLSFATDYTFTGSGSWTDADNWLNGIMPPIGSSLATGNTITVQGTTTIEAAPCTGIPCSRTDYLPQNNGTIIVAVGGVLTLNHYLQFSNAGSIIVNGTLINKTTYQGFSTGTLTINGSVINQGGGLSLSKVFGNQGIITVNNDGALINELGLFDNDMFANKGTIILNSGGALQNVALAVFNIGKVTNNGGAILNSATLKGSATIIGNLENSGTLAPGNSPGTYSIIGNYTATSTSIHAFEVGGSTAGTYDVLTATGTVNLSGVMNITLTSGVSISGSTEIPIITGNINGTFSSTSLPDGLLLEYKPNSVVLKAATPLPVRFVKLAATKQNAGVVLNWKVADEKDVVRYELEKSTDGNRFNNIGVELALLKEAYQFIDRAPNPVAYYRVKSIDRDGKHGYSPIIFLKGEYNAIVLKVFLASSGNELIVQHSTAEKGSKIYVHTIDGKLLKVTSVQSGTQQSTISFPSIASGVYVIGFEKDKGVWETTKVFRP